MKRNIKTHKKRKSHTTEIQIPPVQQKTHPGNDFYKYVNGNWIYRAKIPTYRTSFGVSEEIELQVEAQIKEILKKAYSFAEKGRAPTSKYEEMMDVVGRFMLSVMRPSKQGNSVEYLVQGTRSLYCMQGAENISGHLGIFNRYGIASLLSIGVFEIQTPKQEYGIVLSPGSIGLPDLSYYNATAPGKSRTLLQYVKLCRKVSELLHIEDISKAIQVESVIAPVLEKARRDTYIDMKGGELLEKYKGISWENLFDNYGIPVSVWKQKTIRVYSPRWLRFLQGAMNKWPSQHWTSLFTLHMVLNALPCLPPPYDDLHFEVFGKYLRGQAEKLPQEQLALNLARLILKIPLSYLYIQDYVQKDLKHNITQFAETIRLSAMNRILKIDWMEKPTRETAKEKVQHMKFSISHPSSLPDIKIPDLITDNFLQNIYLMSETNTEALLDRLTNFRESTKMWNDPPYAVNAYYFNETNQFLIPAGTLAWPFYTDDKSKIGWNYGGLGAIIGHEMTHAFDTDGKLYKSNGIKDDWWTRNDNTQYNKRTRELVALFDEGRILNHPVDGYLTLSENIADLGGLGIALDSLKHEIRNMSEEEKKTQMRDFFLSYAVSWRVKMRPKKAIQSLFLDVHAPAELRVNYIVCHFDEWYELFGVETGDELYLPPEKRVRIF